MTTPPTIPPSYHSNGCGCQKGLLRFARIPYGETFRAACEWHDWLYHVGGGSSDRHKADRALFAGMMRRVQAVEQRPIRMWWMTTIALMYYIAVRIFGRHYFNKRKDNGNT